MDIIDRNCQFYVYKIDNYGQVGGWVGGVVGPPVIIGLITVQLKLHLPSGTERGNNMRY